MKKRIAFAAIFIFVFLFTSASALAAEEPGIKPGSFFYGFVTTFEKINLFFTFSPEKKAEKAMKYAEKRLAEAEAVAGDKNSEAVKTAIAGYEEKIALAAAASKKVKDEARAENLLTLIASSTSKHQEVLSAVLIKVPEEAKEAIIKAIEASRKGQEEATRQIAELKSEVEQLKKEVEELKTKDEAKTKAVGELNKQKTENASAPVKQSAPSSQTPAKTTSITTLPNGAVVEMDVNGKILRYIKEAPTDTTNRAPIIPAQPKIYEATPPPVATQIQTQSQTETLEITSVSVTPDMTSAKIEWQTNKPTESKAFISGGNLSSKIFNSASGLSTRHSATISSLSEATAYSYEIEAIAGGVSAVKKSGSFKTLFPPPTPIPTISFLKEENGVASYSLKWEASNADNCEIPKLGIYNTKTKDVAVVTPLSSTTYTITCSGKGGKSSSSIVLVNRYTVLNKDNVSLGLQSLIPIYNLNTCDLPYNYCDMGADFFKLVLTLPANSYSGTIQSIDVTLISELRDNYYFNQLRVKGFMEDRNSICTSSEQQSSQNALCSIYFQIAPTIEYIAYSPVPNEPVVGEAIKKGARFKFDKNLGGFFLIFSAQPFQASLKPGQSGRIKLRIDKIRFRDGAYGEFDLVIQPIESAWVQLTK